MKYMVSNLEHLDNNKKSSAHTAWLTASYLYAVDCCCCLENTPSTKLVHAKLQICKHDGSSQQNSYWVRMNTLHFQDNVEWVVQ